MASLRRPTAADREYFGGRTDFISQPTGFDISPDGKEAVVLTYRSVYYFKRKEDENWLNTLQRQPTEIPGPKAVQNEGITWSVDGQSVYVTTEKIPSPVYRLQFDDSL